MKRFQKSRRLKLGVHEFTLRELERYFAYNDHRKKLLKKAVKAIKNLISAGVVDIWIDGSFVEDKELPNDIDGCWAWTWDSVDFDKIDSVLLDENGTEKMKKKYGVDFYPNVTEGATRKPFLEFFQYFLDLLV